MPRSSYTFDSQKLLESASHDKTFAAHEMVIFHGMRSLRQVAKGALVLPKADRSRPGMITTSQYVGLRHCDLFGHVNNAMFVNIAEIARWECTAPANFAADCYAARIWPVVGSLSVNYYRQLAPFQICTIQTCFFCVTASGKQFVFLQNIYDQKRNLAATVKSYVTMMNTSNRPITVPAAWDLFAESKTGATLDTSFVCGATQINDIDALVKDEALLERLKRAHETVARIAPQSGAAHNFAPRYPEHDILSYECLRSNAEAVAHASTSFTQQRNWNKAARK